VTFVLHGGKSRPARFQATWSSDDREKPCLQRTC
jgi:hypothetical protein